MFADLDETLRKLLIKELPIRNGEIEVSFQQPKREWSARLNRPTLNLYLYDVRENPTLRQHQMERALGDKPGSAHASLKRSPYRVDALYMLTVWASDPDDEHRLLARAMLALFRHPLLPAEMLVDSLQNQPYDLPARLASHDRLTNPAELWSSLDNEMRPSISYIVTLAMDPWTAITTPVVRTLTLRSGQASGLPVERYFTENTLLERLDIGGVVKDPRQEGAPVAGIRVAVKGTGLFSTSDSQGRYVLGSLPAGEYVLVAWPPQGLPFEKTIRLPGKPDEYDLEINAGKEVQGMSQ